MGCFDSSFALFFSLLMGAGASSEKRHRPFRFLDEQVNRRSHSSRRDSCWSSLKLRLGWNERELLAHFCKRIVTPKRQCETSLLIVRVWIRVRRIFGSYQISASVGQARCFFPPSTSRRFSPSIHRLTQFGPISSPIRVTS